jgi:tight adherence protein C
MQLLAAVVAFVACMIVLSSLRRADASRRRGVRRLVEAQEVAHIMGDAEGPQIRQWLLSAGFYGENAVVLYFACTIAASLLGGLFAAAGAGWADVGPLGVILFATAGAFIGSRVLPTWIDSRWSQRARRIREGFPLMLDMLDVCTTAGMAVDEAWQAVERQLYGVNNELSDEMAIVAVEVRLGIEREIALRHMAERSGVGDAAALASMLVQSERFGSGMAETFRSQAKAMREEHARALEERVHRSSATAVLPVAVLMLPAFLLVTVAPMAVLLHNALTRDLN